MRATENSKNITVQKVIFDRRCGFTHAKLGGAQGKLHETQAIERQYRPVRFTEKVTPCLRMVQNI